MEWKRNKQASILLWASVAALLSQNLVISVMPAPTLEDQKNYFPPYTHPGTPPIVSYTPPAHGGGGHATPTPSHGGSTSPANCGNPPSGGRHHSTPTPSHGGGHHHSPPTSTPSNTPTTPTPIIVTPPATPTIVPGAPSTPGFTVPSPPFSFDPNSPPFTCTYWRNHPTLIWGLFGWWGTTVGTAFGVSGNGANTKLLEALSNTRADGLGDLYREGTAALLNSMVHTKFPYTTSQVRNSFVAALGSNKAAAAQAKVFKLANEGKTSPKV